MVGAGQIARGEIWLAKLDPTIGSEIKKTRPCLIVSPNELNNRLPTVIVAPLTSGSFGTSFRIPLWFDNKAGLILLDQLRTLDHRRFVKKLGTLDAQTMTAALNVLIHFFAD